MKQHQEELKEKQKEEKPTKQKAKIRKKGSTKQEQKNKSAENSVFIETSPVNFWNKTIFDTKKTPMHNQCFMVLCFVQ